jgi:hypothetical protein
MKTVQTATPTTKGANNMKTARYYIQFENIEIAMSTQMEISKTEYTRQLKHLREQVIATETNEYSLNENDPIVYDLGTATKTTISFNCGCAYTDLIKIECKDGYCFKNK